MCVFDRLHPFHLILGILAFAVMLCCSAGPSAAEQPTIQDISQQHQAWKDSFTNLRVVYEQSNADQYSADAQESAEVVSTNSDYDRVEWAITDEKWFRHTTRSYLAGAVHQMMILGDNKDFSFRAFYSSPEAVANEVATVMEIENSHIADWPRSYICPPITPLIGVRYSARWLYERDQRFSFFIERIVEWEGSRCAIIRQPETSDSSVWLDLDHDALPRRIEPGPIGNGTQFHVAEFQQLKNGHWFPRRGTLSFRDNELDQARHWKVLEVEINEPVKQAQFGPPIPDKNTRLRDKTGRFLESLQRTATSSSEDVSHVSQSTENDQGPPVKELENSWFWFLLGGGTTLLLLGLLWKRRGAKRSENRAEEGR